MLNDRTTHILARLERGFRTDTALLKAQEEDLVSTLQSGRFFAGDPESEACGSPGRIRQWDTVQGILRHIRELVDAMDADISQVNGVRLERAIHAWEIIQSEDTRLVAALRQIRHKAPRPDTEAAAEWAALTWKLELHLESLCSCIQALRVKVELLRNHSPQEVEELIQRVLKVLPKPDGIPDARSEGPARDFRRAARELEKERHLYLGFTDVVKGLLMWVETPEERVDRNHILDSVPT